MRQTVWVRFQRFRDDGCTYANHEVGNPGSPKKKGKNSSSCAGEPYGSEPGNDSEMMDVRGVERQAYSKEAPGKSPVVHSLENPEGEDPCGKPHSSREAE